jgi:hypothetical protein
VQPIPLSKKGECSLSPRWSGSKGIYVWDRDASPLKDWINKTDASIASTHNRG